MAENNFLRQVNTVPNFGVDLLFNANENEIPAGDLTTTHIIPKGKVIFGVIYRNIENNVAGSGTILAKIGSTALGTAENVADVKGTSVVQVLATPVIATGDPVKLTVGTSAITGGDLNVVILYA